MPDARERAKPRLALYWAASCGGCEVSFLNLNAGLLEWLERVELVFCPCLIDVKRAEVEALEDGSIDFTLLNGAMRTTENVEMAELLRRKSKWMIAFGACSKDGGVVGLGNLRTREQMMEAIYPGEAPWGRSLVAEGALELPELLERVLRLADVVEVDYEVPGCPPEPHTIDRALRELTGPELPKKGSVLGSGPSTVCAECARSRGLYELVEIRRPHEMTATGVRCLLEQGLLCLGPATREGCGGLCPRVNSGCSGCYGAPEGTRDQGAAMISALGSVLEASRLRGMSEEELRARARRFAETIVDPVGSWYKYTLASSILGGAGGAKHSN